MDTLEEHATEGSTYAVVVEFSDEDGNGVVPDSANWTLTDLAGNVINERENKVIGSLAQSVTILLQGADLTVVEAGWLELTMESTYTSSLGTGLPCNQGCRFKVEDLVAL